MNVTIFIGRYMGDSQPTHFTCNTKPIFHKYAAVMLLDKTNNERDCRSKSQQIIVNYTTNPQPRTDVSSKSYHGVWLSDWAAVCTILDLHKSLEKNLEIRCRPHRSTSLICTKAWHRYRNKKCQALTRAQYNRCKITMLIRCCYNNDDRNITLIYLQGHTS